MKSKKTDSLQQLKTKAEFYEKLVQEKKIKNETLNKLLYEKNKQIIELNRKIEYLLQEQKYEVIEILQSLNKAKFDEDLLSHFVEKYNISEVNEPK